MAKAEEKETVAPGEAPQGNPTNPNYPNLAYPVRPVTLDMPEDTIAQMKHKLSHLEADTRHYDSKVLREYEYKKLIPAIKGKITKAEKAAGIKSKTPED